MSGVGKVFEAIRSRIDEKTRDRREFKTRQAALFNEGLIQFKLREQLQQQVNLMDKDPHITSIKVQVAPEAVPFLETIACTLNCKTQACPVPDEIILIKQEDYL